MRRFSLETMKRALLVGVAVPLGGFALAADDVVTTRADLVRQFLARPEGTVSTARATRGVREFILEVREVHAEIASGVRVKQWAFSRPNEAPIVPGPVLRARVGELVRITLRNTHDQPHTIHLHGIVSLAQEMDGVPHTGRVVKPGESFTYEFVATEPGTHAYHCHVQTNVHLDMGMYGALVIEDDAAERAWSREHVLVLDEWDSRHEVGRLPYRPDYDVFLVNGRAHPLIPPLEIPADETHLVRFVHMGAQVHSLHLHGTSFLVLAKDGHELPLPYVADTLPISPGERYDVLVKGRDGVFPWHDHNANANTTRGTYPGGMHFDVEGSAALRADGSAAAELPDGHGHAHESAAEVTSNAVVAVSDFEFSPERVRVKAGGRVTWENRDAVSHHVTVTVDGQERHLELPPGGRATLTFEGRGTFAYRCSPHPFMRGVVDVE